MTSRKEDEFFQRLQAMFFVEAEERIKVMSSGLLQLEEQPQPELQEKMVETIFREAHSLKGAARSVNITDIETICHALENILALVKRKELSLSPAVFDILHKSLDTMTNALADPSGNSTAVLELLQILKTLEKSKPKEENKAETSLIPSHILDSLHNLAPVAKASLDQQVPGDTGKQINQLIIKSNEDQNIRISTTKLDEILYLSEELLSAKLSAAQLVSDLRSVTDSVKMRQREWYKLTPLIRKARKMVDMGKDFNDSGDWLKVFTALLEVYEKEFEFIKQLDKKTQNVRKLSEHNHRYICGNVDKLLKQIKKTLMQPVSTLFHNVPKDVRDLSRAQGKEVKVNLHGLEVEVDKRILEQLKDPILHIVRNCIDHGIETPEVRKGLGKTLQGILHISVTQVGGNKVEIVIADDGAGIDLAQVQKAAVSRGLLTKQQEGKLGYKELLDLIFLSELSTSPMITDISGRGLGLAIVREKVESLGGEVAVETRPATGTTFKLLLPVAISTFRGTLVKTAEQNFIVPSSSIKQVLRIKREDVKTVENQETLAINGQVVPLINLAEVLELSYQGIQSQNTDPLKVLVVSSSQKQIAFQVDEIISEQEVLVKPLGKQLKRVRNISGVTVLGTGQVVPILHVPDLIKAAIRYPTNNIKAVASEPRQVDQRKSVLIVEDSITSRMLLKNIVQSAGYRVISAVDGVDALTTLKTEEFHLVVSDVEMPRMNGFDLTAQIRGDEKLSHLPVILVTSLDSREDRERGIDVGANAYIVKSSFDHSDLLSVIKRLI
ncbi:response regulator [Desulfotomaculum defluvii]